MNKLQWFLSCCIGIAAIAAFVISWAVRTSFDTNTFERIPRPDFSSFSNVTEKKQAFFDYMLPSVRQANDLVLKDRELVVRWQQAFETRGYLSERDLSQLDSLAARYEIDAELDTDEKLEFLALRVDMIPASLALAQAAKESGWGTSRFSRDANNFFGEWCYSEGCGLVPSRRNEGAMHEVRAFDDVDDSIAAYIHNLNTHPPYRHLRELRAKMRDAGEITGISLAQGLSRYSERGPVYIGEVQSIIRVNELQSLDRSLETAIE